MGTLSSFERNSNSFLPKSSNSSRSSSGNEIFDASFVEDVVPVLVSCLVLEILRLLQIAELCIP